MQKHSEMHLACSIPLVIKLISKDKAIPVTGCGNT
jgi:hypothetical protein